jgi:phage N-6-adenine-methyltransferase
MSKPIEAGASTKLIWSTPQPIFDAVAREFNIMIDLCAEPENAKCERYFTREESLSREWGGCHGWAWLNPPYGKEVADWVKKAAESHAPIIAMLPGRTNAPWWHDYVMQAMIIRFIRRKVSFVEPNGKKGVPPYGSVLAIFAHHEEAPVICASWDWRKCD